MKMIKFYDTAATDGKGAPDPAVETVLKAIGESKAANKVEMDGLKASFATDIQVVKDEMDKIKGTVAKIDAAAGMPKADTGKTATFADSLYKGLQENADAIAKFARAPRQQAGSVSFEMAKAMSYDSNFSTADASVSNLRPGIVELPQRKLHLRDLLPSGSMNTRDFVYVRETAEGGTVAPWATGNKAEVASSFAEVTAPSRDIAGYVQIPVAMLEDVDGMMSFLQRRLLTRYLKAEDLAIMYGANDTAPNFTGLTVAATGAASASPKIIDKLVLSLASLESDEYAGNGILLHPVNYMELLLNQTSGDEYTYPVVFNALTGQLTLAGVPVFKSTAINAGYFLMGDWTEGAQLITRKPPVVEFFYETGTNVITNQVTVRVEGRVALPIYHTGAWIYDTVGAFS